jgi:N-methylhydantoinase A
MTKYIIGSDIGGTFTDIICTDAQTGEHLTAKVPSTPPDYVRGIMNGLKMLGINGSDVLDIFAHGSTIATNAIVQRQGAKTGLLTTYGFRDILLAARADREVLYNLSWDPPPPLVPRRDILTVHERIDYEGNEVAPLAEDEVEKAGKIFAKRNMEAIAVTFINSFVNPSHERRAADILKKTCPECYIATSHEILPEIREFERMSTTVANAYIGPVSERYLGDLKENLRIWNFNGEITVTHSGGGVMDMESAMNFPIRTCHSSPVSGAVGLAKYVGELCGHNNIITFEMGGTTTDVALFLNGQPMMTYEWRVQFNIPVLFPAIDAVYIGAGGGSVAWVDQGGALHVGPMSAGAVPGPACYGSGGEDPTITDAQLVLKRINPSYFLGGAMRVNENLAQKAIRDKVGSKFGWEEERAAEGIIRLAIANMTNAIRLISIQKGYDPRDFLMVAYGGAGPLHAGEVARELRLPFVAIPPLPGYASAFGASRLDARQDLSKSVLKVESELLPDEIEAHFKELEGRVAEIFKKSRIALRNVRVERFVDVRYYDQTNSLTVPVPPGKITADTLRKVSDSFLEEHKRRFGYIMPEGYAEIEFVNVRVAASGESRKPALEVRNVGTLENATKETRKVYFGKTGDFIETTIYERLKLPSETKIKGPAILEQSDSTIVVQPEDYFTVDRYSNVLIHLKY